MIRLRSNYQKTLEHIFDTIELNIDNVLKNYSYNGNVNDSEEIKDIIICNLENVLENEVVVNGMTELIKFDKDIVNHSINVAILSVILGIKNQLNIKSIENLAMIGFLHDIGKAEIFKNHPHLADKNYKYNKKDRELMQMHPILAYEILSNIELTVPNSVLRAILLHHVWQKPEYSFSKARDLYLSYPLYFNGQQLSGQHKDTIAEIIQIVDYFDVVSSKKNKTIIETLGMIKKMEGIRFSKEVTKLLIEFVAPYSIGEIVELNDNSTAVVIEQTSDPRSPIIKIRDGLLHDRVINLLENSRLFITKETNIFV